MSSKVAWIILINARKGQSYIWDHLESIIEDQKKYQDVFPIICGFGEFPPEIHEKYETVSEKYNSVPSMENFIKVLPAALQAAINSGCEKTLITKFGTWIDSEQVFKNKSFLIGNIHQPTTIQKRHFEFYGMYAKTAIINKMLTSIPWNPMLSDERNMYNMIRNMYGDELEEICIDKKLIKVRTIISRGYWYDSHADLPFFKG